MEITVKELSDQTGFSLPHIAQLQKRGILPKGRKEGNSRYVDEVECKMVLYSHDPGFDWKERKKGAERKPRAKKNTEPGFDWQTLR